MIQAGYECEYNDQIIIWHFLLLYLTNAKNVYFVLEEYHCRLQDKPEILEVFFSWPQA